MGRIPIPCEAIIVYARDEESSFDTLIAEKIKKLGSMPIPSSVITHKLETFDKRIETHNHGPSSNVNAISPLVEHEEISTP